MSATKYCQSPRAAVRSGRSNAAEGPLLSAPLPGTMKFFLDHASRSTYPVQVVRQATAQMVAGRLQPGDRLPSVRQFARELGIARTTAERIHEALCDSMVAELRPCSGAFVAEPEGQGGDDIRSMRAIYAFLKETAQKAGALGLDVPRLVQLLGNLERTGNDRASQAVYLPLVATRDFFECVAYDLGTEFPATLLHVPPGGPPAVTDRRLFRARYVLSSYYMRARARKIAEELGRPLLYLRYNTPLLDEWADIPEGEVRTLLTRDVNNADTIKVFLAHAYPEVPPARYRVLTVAEWLKAAEDCRAQPVWATSTAEPFLKGIPPGHVRPLHPILAEDFVDELRCLALLS
jgi:DNA-binding transcriptional regulator YhcF (GntR family)